MATVLQLSDTHFTADGSAAYDLDPAQRLATVLAAWQAGGGTADLILLSGDLTDDGSLSGCQDLAAVVGGLGVPVFAIPGNHDDPDAVAATFGPDGEFELAHWRVLGIDSVIPGQVQGRVSVEDLERRLDALDDKPTVIAVHHPPWSPSQHHWFRLDNGADVVARLQRHPHVRGVLSGHLHQPFDRQDGGLALLSAPSTIYGARHEGTTWRRDPSVPTGARIVTLTDDGALSSELLIA